MQKRLADTENRGLFYALYSRIFMLEADEALLKMIEKKEIKEFFPNLFEWEEYSQKSKQENIDTYLNVDFTDLSLINLVPYESFYLREDGQIESGGDNPVYQAYEEFDFIVEKDKARVVSPDHIGVELEFMYMLCNAEAKALANSDAVAADALRQKQKDFLHKHLLRWVPLYLINVKNEARTPLYHDAAMTGLDFILSDYEYLNA